MADPSSVSLNTKRGLLPYEGSDLHGPTVVILSLPGAEPGEHVIHDAGIMLGSIIPSLTSQLAFGSTVDALFVLLSALTGIWLVHTTGDIVLFPESCSVVNMSPVGTNVEAIGFKQATRDNSISIGCSSSNAAMVMVTIKAVMLSGNSHVYAESTMSLPSIRSSSWIIDLASRSFMSTFPTLPISVRLILWILMTDSVSDNFTSISAGVEGDT